MTRNDQTLLALVRAGIQGEKPADPALDGSDWETVLELAERHKLLPLVLDAAFSLPSARAVLGKSLPPGGKVSPEATDEGRSDWRALVLSQVNRQVVQENEFLNLILALRERGLEPLVVKGAICRKLYPKPLLRPSVDDDLLIRPEQVAAFHAALLELGLLEDHGATDPNALWELSYHKPDSPLYIELHTCLFDPESFIQTCFSRSSASWEVFTSASIFAERSSPSAEPSFCFFRYIKYSILPSGPLMGEKSRPRMAK